MQGLLRRRGARGLSMHPRTLSVLAVLMLHFSNVTAQGTDADIEAAAAKAEALAGSEAPRPGLWELPATDDTRTPPQTPVDTALALADGAREWITDVRSTEVWNRYQAGVLDGWHYRIYPDGSAVFSPLPQLRDDRTSVSCDAALSRCDAVQRAGESETAIVSIGFDSAGHLARSGQGSETGPVQRYIYWALAQGDGPDGLTTRDGPGRIPAAQRSYCARVQLALLSHGLDPGPVDGLPGPRTLAEVHQLVPDAGTDIGQWQAQQLLQQLLDHGGAALATSTVPESAAEHPASAVEP